LFRALPCQGRGRELESLNPHQISEFEPAMAKRVENMVDAANGSFPNKIN